MHFVLDEAASLGHMEALADAVDKYRGYGVRLQFYNQSLGQLKKCWPEGGEQTLLSNTAQVFFGVNDQPTAEYVSSRLGEFTQIVTSGGKSGGTSRQYGEHGHGSNSYSESWSDNWQQAGRKLLKPEEVMALPQRTAVTFMPGVPPIATTLLRYYEEHLGKKPSRFWPAFWALIDAVCLLLVAAVLTGLAGGLGPSGAPGVPVQENWLFN